MLGAIIGDIVGSTREWHNIKREDFELVPKGSRFTDDTVMTLAVAEWLMTDPEHQPETLVARMQRLGRKYPHAGYGKMFSQWLMSDHPQPYNSFGNGSAMRVSPVGLYANSLEEALELARITASVSHNHPEGIKGAQAIAGCVFLHKNIWLVEEDEIRWFITEKIGYNLNFNLDDIRDAYGFDVTCQGSVPIAIKAYLERGGYPAEKALRLAISMGGDSDTIGAMTASIAGAERFSVIGGGFRDELVNQCRALLPADLLDINDRFEAFVSCPLHQSYYCGGKLFAGEYPGDKYGELAEAKLKRMHHFGVRHFVDLTEEGELRPYRQLLPSDTTYLRFPIRDVNVPESVEAVHQLIDKMEYLMQQDGYTYIHCWGGVGRTGTIVACYEARQMEEPTLEKALTAMRSCFSGMPKASHRKSPETQEQIDFVRKFVDSCTKKKEVMKLRTKDRIRGSLMAGAAGDALGYTVEFMSRKSILAQYGSKGITKFDLSSDGKALVSDDTQMTLFTACGMLMGVTRGYMRGIGGEPEKYVDGAYLDWYYTQTGKKKQMLTDDFHYTWLRDLPELAHRRAPGNTCLSACESLYQGKKVQNNSKGCGGIMRVAPMALLMAGYWSRGESFYNVQQMDEAGAEVAAVTHKHPLAFLPAAMLTHLIYSVIRMEENEIRANMADIALETIDALDNIYKGEYEEDKRYLANLTHMAVAFAANDKSDAENIRMLGEGWTGEEAWAIALYCAVRHVDSIEEALIASVNHDGDSDSTGAVCGNIMGAIYGYEAMKRKRLFCPQGKNLEQTLELSDIILTFADDLYTSCIISEYAPIDTPEKRQWYERYCNMKPVGLNKKLMYNREYTPERISELKENEVFVFGSNLAGAHGGGAARLAYNRFGAVWGEGVGLHGQTYAIPTMQGGVETIKPYVDDFIRFAQEHSRLTFLVTRIGCGIAGFRDEEIAPLFKDAIEVKNVILPEDFVEVLSRTQNYECSSIIKWDSEKDFLEKYRALMKRVNGGDSTAYYQVKELRAKEFRNTVEIVNQGHYESESGIEYIFPDDSNMMRNTTFYESEIHMVDFPQCDDPTIVEVQNIDCLYAGVRLKEHGYNPAVLNMASRRNPGGGVATGAGAQEETLFRRTNLFRSLYQFAPYAEQYGIKLSRFQYPLDRNFGGVYTPSAIYFRECEQKGYALLEEPVCLSFITVAGMNRPDLTIGGMIANHHVEPIMNKIRTIFRIGLVHGHDSLVLGALGCGAFRNPPRHVARLFHEVMDEPEFKNRYRFIVFAILDDHNAHQKHNPVGNFSPFAEEFDHTGNKESSSVDTVKVLSEKSLYRMENWQESSIKVNDNVSDGRMLHQERFGEGLIWRLYSNGILEISGNGRMPDYINHWFSYTGEGQAPWVGCDRYGVMPNKLRISEGITYIGENAFESFGCLKEIVLPQSLQEIGKEAFFDCFHVEKINLPHHMNIDYFDLAELPLYYNKEFVIVGDKLVQRKV